METIALLLIGFILGAGLIWHALRHRRTALYGDLLELPAIPSVNRERQKEKEERKTRILAYLRKESRISNNDVEKLLHVSDATATRYLEELEQEEKIEQRGRGGRSVHYRLK